MSWWFSIITITEFRIEFGIHENGSSLNEYQLENSLNINQEENTEKKMQRIFNIFSDCENCKCVKKNNKKINEGKEKGCLFEIIFLELNRDLRWKSHELLFVNFIDDHDDQNYQSGYQKSQFVFVSLNILSNFLISFTHFIKSIFL